MLEDTQCYIFRELLTAIVMINVFDIFITKYLLDSGLFYEANTWLCSLHNKYGYISTIAVIKFSLAILLAAGIRLSAPPDYIIIMLTFATSTYFCLMLWQIFLISFTTRII